MLVELIYCLLLLLCRKERILSTLDRTRHQAAPWSSLPSSFSLYGVHRHTFILAAPIASCRLILAAPSDQPNFGETAINRNTFGVPNRLHLSWEEDVQVVRLPKTIQPRIPSQRPNELIPYATCAALPETGSHVTDLFNCQD